MTQVQTRVRTDRGFPTAITGDEWGVKRRLAFLSRYFNAKGKTLLDLGCGVGAYGKLVLDLGASHVIGVDLNEYYLSRAKIPEKVQSSGDFLPFKASYFDLLFLIEVLDHAIDEKKVLSEANRVLKDDGVVFITVPNKFFPFETHGARICSTVIKNILGLGIPFLSWMPMIIRNRTERAHIYTQKQITSILSKQGFEVLQVDYMMPPLDGKLHNQTISTALRKLLHKIEHTKFKYFGCHILILARRS